MIQQFKEFFQLVVIFGQVRKLGLNGDTLAAILFETYISCPEIYNLL